VLRPAFDRSRLTGSGWLSFEIRTIQRKSTCSFFKINRPGFPPGRSSIRAVQPLAWSTVQNYLH